MITSKISLSLIKLATFSIQFSFAVRSRSTVAAGYFIEIKSFYDYKNRSTMSTILLRCFYNTLIPSGWQAHNSKILATALYSVLSIGRFTIALIKELKMSALINHNDKVSYISLSLNSSIISITVHIKFYRVYFSV